MRAASTGDADARGRLVDAYLPLIGSVARNYRGTPRVDRSELMQEGVVGLLTALRRYDPELGTPFWAYASWWVRYEMQQLVAQLSRPIALSDRALRKLARIKQARSRYLQSHSREPSAAELAAETALSAKQVESLIAAERIPRGLDERVGADQEGGATVGDLLADSRAEDAYEDAIRRVEVERLRSLDEVLRERERTVLRARYGIDRPTESLREIAGHLGLSAERVRQIEQRALEKLRADTG